MENKREKLNQELRAVKFNKMRIEDEIIHEITTSYVDKMILMNNNNNLGERMIRAYLFDLVSHTKKIIRDHVLD